MKRSVLIPAAGAASRMRGLDKLTLPARGGGTLLRHAVEIALASAEEVCLTLPLGGPHAGARRAAVSGCPVRILEIPDWAEGIAASLRQGAALTGEGVMILLPDMPGLQAADLAALWLAFQAAPDQPLRAAAEGGQAGHPVILPRRLVPALAGLTGDQGARSLLAANPPRLLPLAGQRAILDLDTTAAFSAWLDPEGPT